MTTTQPVFEPGDAVFHVSRPDRVMAVVSEQKEQAGFYICEWTDDRGELKFNTYRATSLRNHQAY